MRTILRLIKLYGPYRNWIVLGILVSFLSVLANVTLMAVSGWFITAMGLAGVAGVSMNYFTPAAMIRACAIIRTGGRYAERLVTHDATLRFLSHLRRRVYECMEIHPISETGKYRSGDWLSRLGGDIDRLERFYIGFVVPAVTALAACLVFVAYLFFHHVMLALFVGSLLLFSGLLFPLLMLRQTREPEETEVQKMTALRTELVGCLQGMGELLVYDTENSYGARQEKIEADLIKAQKRINRFSVMSNAVVEASSYSALWGTLLIAIPLVTTDAIMPADLALLALFSLVVFEAVLPLPVAFRSLSAVEMSAKRIFDVLDYKPLEEPHKTKYEPELERCSFQFKDVCFSYDRGPVLKAVSFDIKSGEKVAVIGPTGAGKSSLINLITGLWPLDEGAIILNDKRLADYAGEDIRRHFSVVPQRPHVFSTTIRQNLLIAEPEADEKMLEEVCDKAGLLSFIKSLPDGFDHYVGESGLQLSGGQTRRLAIARALLKKAPCLVLDEPGEGLDARTEHDVMARILSFVEECTLLLVTHSLVGLPEMDRIVVLEEGRVSHQGTHEALLKSAAYYRGLYELV